MVKRRSIKAGAFKVNGENIQKKTYLEDGMIVQVGKRKFCKN